jgi:leucyl-tRNA synthetase
MFNYPSGAGIHIGHAMNYTISDVKARFKRQQGFESYHPVGWDAFGLPAENYAIKAGVSPQESMATIIPSYHKQYKAMGWSNDWEKEIATHLPEYYKWTQWIFSQMYMQWWCTKCQTVLANEQVIDGKCWRHDAPDDPLVQQKEVKQWFFKITEYADELLEAISGLDWTESVKLAQKNWIGRSHGMLFTAPVKDTGLTIQTFSAHFEAFTADTFVVIAPDHPFLPQLVSGVENESEILAAASAMVLDREKHGFDDESVQGVFTGRYIVDPVGNGDLPIWISSYALADYGTGIVKCSARF